MPLLKQKYRKRGGPNWVSSSMTLPAGGKDNTMAFASVQNSREIAKDYIGSIMYPGSNTGVKIPDFNLYPTVTAHTEREGTFSCSAAGNGGMLVRLHAGQGPGPAVGAGGAIDIQNPGTTTDLAFTYLAVDNVRANPAAFNASYGFCRLVSASLEVQFVGNDTQNSGRIVQGILVKNEYVAATYPSFNSILSSRDNMTASVEGGAYCRYRPVDESSFDFVELNDTSTANNQGAFIVAVNACGAGAPFRYKLSCNWECIIRSDAFDQPISNQAALSPSDPKAFDEAKSVMAAIPGANLLSNEKITKNDNNPAKATAEADNILSTILGGVANFAENYGGIPGLVAKGYKMAKSTGYFGGGKARSSNKVLRASGPGFAKRGIHKGSQTRSGIPTRAWKI